MMTPELNTLQDLPEFESRPLDISVALALLWLVADDEKLALNDCPSLKKHLVSLSLTKKMLKNLLSLVRQGKTEHFIQAFNVLRSQLQVEEKEFFLDMSIEVAGEKQPLKETANHILRFYADLLEIDTNQLEQSYRKYYRDALPPPGDLSSPAWWAAREFRADIANNHDEISTRAQALVILGLTEDATAEQIKNAYRRQVQNYHPDRVKSGDNAAAKTKFLLIRKAYEVLKS